MVRSQRHLADRQSSLQEPLGVCRTALGRVEISKIAQRTSNAEVVGPVDPLLNQERSPTKSFRLIEVAQGTMERSEIVETARNVRVFRSKDLLPDCQGS